MSKYIIIGAGGHGRVALDALLCLESEIIGFTEHDTSLCGALVDGVSIIGDDDSVLRYATDEVLLVNGIGSVGSTARRQEVYERFKAKGYRFATVIHPSAVVSSRAILGEGVQVLAGAVINTGVRIGDNTIINTRASIDHDVVIGNHVHIAPGVTVSGGVTVEDGTHIGTGASIIQGVHIGAGVIIGAGSVVLHDIAAGSKVYGVPAK